MKHSAAETDFSDEFLCHVYVYKERIRRKSIFGNGFLFCVYKEPIRWKPMFGNGFFFFVFIRSGYEGNPFSEWVSVLCV